MAYRGNNLLLMEQRRAAIEDAQRQRQNQNIQQAMAVAEDIKNQQFERQRKQAEVHGKLAEQLMLKREPFAKAPIEESAILGQMQAMADRQKMMSQQQREDDKWARGLQAQKDRDADALKGRIKVERTRRNTRRLEGRKNTQMLKDLVTNARIEKQEREKELRQLTRDPYIKPNPKELAQAEEDLRNANENYNRWATEAARAAISGQVSPEVLEHVGLPPNYGRRRKIQKQEQNIPPQEFVPVDKVTGETPWQQIADPVLQNIAKRKQEDPLSQGYKQTKQQQTIHKAKGAVGDLIRKKLDEIGINVHNLVLDKIEGGMLRDLAAMYAEGDDLTRTRIDWIIKRAVNPPNRPHKPLLTMEEWQKALARTRLETGGTEETPITDTPTTEDIFRKVQREREKGF